MTIPSAPPSYLPIRLIVGLGNPGQKYEDTRHNCGFCFLDQYARLQKVVFNYEKRFQGEMVRIGETVLLKPHTWMNRSGESVLAVSQFYKISSLQTLVVHDELDIKAGQLRLKQGGGSAGHNGIKSIAQCWGNSDFLRLRIGIGSPRDATDPIGKKQDVADFVLDRPSAEEFKLLDASMRSAFPAISYLQRGELESAKRLLHTAPQVSPLDSNSMHSTLASSSLLPIRPSS